MENIEVIEAKTVETTVRKTITLDGTAIRRLIADIVADIPASAEIYVNVPGGGDWSNMALDIDKSTPVVVQWTETETIA